MTMTDIAQALKTVQIEARKRDKEFKALLARGGGEG